MFGDYNPAGRLPISIPRSTGQLPIYYNHDKPARHSYIDQSSTPLFPFGYGLSYSTFDYGSLAIDSSQTDSDLLIKILVQVKNNGPFDGDEVVQLYLRDQESSVVTAVQQLTRFKRIFLKNGEQQTIEFHLTPADLALWNQQGKWVVEKGDFQVMVGSSSQDIRLEGRLRIPQDILLKDGSSVERQMSRTPFD